MSKKLSIQYVVTGFFCFIISILFFRVRMFSSGYFVLFPMTFLCLGSLNFLYVSSSITKQYYNALRFAGKFLSSIFLFWSIVMLLTPSCRNLTAITSLFALVAIVPPESSLEFVMRYGLALFGQSFYQVYIAECYVYGEEIQKNAKKAFKWFVKAAKKENRKAEYYLGIFYEFGIGIDADLSEAMKWYWEAASLGYPAAIARINQPLIQKNAKSPFNFE